MTLEQWPVERLIDYARNPRKNDHAVAQMAAVITEFGFRIPVVARSTGEIVDGHLRLKAARRLGLTSVPVVLADELTDAQIKAFRLLANRSATWAEWDQAMLALELEDLKLADFDLSLTGFDADEIEALLADDHTDAEQPGDGNPPDAGDDVPDVPSNPVSRTGDVWTLGPHRLICGDAADSAVITPLMAGDRARVCFTSPPYGNQRDYTSGGITDWDGLMRGVFVDLPMTDDGQVLVNLGLIHRDSEVIPYWDNWLAWMRTQGWRRFAWYIWDQGPGMPGDWAGRFAPSFEFVFHFNHQSRKPNKIVRCKHAGQDSHLRADGSSTAMRGRNGEVGGWTAAGQPTQDNRIPDSVIRVMRHKGKIGQDIDHPAVFPIALPEFILEAYSDTGDLVFEPFCGSGTTMLAAQRTGRIARSVEIAPEYVDVAIKRFQQNFAGVPVTLVATGQTFDEVADERLGSDDADR
nr:DNA modification methylase [Candidatus Accumulibacter phosphatis]